MAILTVISASSFAERYACVGEITYGEIMIIENTSDEKGPVRAGDFKNCIGAVMEDALQISCPAADNDGYRTQMKIKTGKSLLLISGREMHDLFTMKCFKKNN